jgi:hypothetical protein
MITAKHANQDYQIKDQEVNLAWRDLGGDLSDIRKMYSELYLEE